MNRHVEALAEEFLGRGHHVRVLAPFDPPGRLSRLAHRAAPQPREMPDYLMPLGRTIGIGANGAVSNLSSSPKGGVYDPRRELRRKGDYDVVHIHEPLVPLVGWNAALGSDGADRRHLPRLLDQGAPQPHRHRARRPPHVQPALGPDRRLRGRRLDRAALVRRPLRDHPQRRRHRRRPDRARSRPPRSCGSLFVGRAEERKGLPILLSAFGALAEHVPCRLTVIGAEREEVLRYLADPETMRHIDVHGRVSGEELWKQLHDADLLCAPSLAGESFGMVLTEAFAAGTPVIASAIAGYSDVVTDGVDGVLVPPGDPQRLAEELQRAYHEPERLRAMGEAAARKSAERYAWPRVADRVTEVYERAIEAPEPVTAGERFAALGRAAARRRRSAGAASEPAVARPAPGPARQPQAPRRPPRRHSASPPSLGVGLTVLAARKIGVDNVVESIVRSDVTWVLIASGADGPLALRPRRLLVLDRPRRAAQPARAPPRRDLGDDDRRADVGDPAGPARRAGQGALALAPDRARCGRRSRSWSGRSSRRRCSTSSPCCCSG